MFHNKKNISVMPFGKYKSQKFSEIVKITEVKDEIIVARGKEYLRWIYEQTFPSQELKDAIQPYLTQE